MAMSDLNVVNFNNELIQKFHENRKGDVKDFNKSEDYEQQQSLYGKYARVYDASVTSQDYIGFRIVSDKVKELYPDQKDSIKILDFGCGTGLVADCLHGHGYTNIDGLDPCQEFLDVARSKGKIKNLFELRSKDDDSVIPSCEYDVVCSSGVLYVSPSHPGFECIPKICRYVKPGGRIIICTANKYLNNLSDIENQNLEDMVEQGKLKIEQKLVVENYRRPMHEVEGEEPLQGALLVFKVL